jgi:hypothetical protein
MNCNPSHPFVPQTGCNICVCGLPQGAPEHDFDRPTDDQVDAFGRLFARILDHRDGVGSRAAVDEAAAKVIDLFGLCNDDHPDGAA